MKVIMSYDKSRKMNVELCSGPLVNNVIFQQVADAE